MTVLLVTETGDLAADLVALELQKRGSAYRRLNQDLFPDTVEVAREPGRPARWWTPDWELSATEVRSAWYRTPSQVVHVDPYVDAEARAVLASLWLDTGWAWINRPAALASASDKLWQLHRAAEIGLDVPKTVVTNRLERVVAALGSGPVIAKTFAGAVVDLDGGRHHLYTQLLSGADLDEAAVRAAPCIFQSPVKPGVDVRVTVVGRHVMAVEIDAPTDTVDWRAAPAADVSYRPVTPPRQVAAACVRLCREAGLVFGAIDFVRQPDDRWVFLEINPSGQWGWIEQATGVPITATIVDALLDKDMTPVAAPGQR